ncbi:hypothetical protein L1049_019554 [Liquidambar formosana]|uniref:S-protein homolog n=1 Tax=Liquidambar formosana TaxID=63359 RepID=A0AAP0SBT4_LIQFO
MDALKPTSGGLTLVVTVLFLLGQLSQVSGLPFEKVTVTLVNELWTKSPLYLRCRSDDDDLGVQLLYYKQSYRWSFRINIWETTNFWCDFHWDFTPEIFVSGMFTIYDARRDQVRKSCEGKTRATQGSSVMGFQFAVRIFVGYGERDNRERRERNESEILKKQSLIEI